MNAAVVTLFEGHYHYGVAALANSLVNKGYQGSIYAGYRGNLPKWAAAASQTHVAGWPGCRSLQVSGKVTLHFLPLETDYHFTNYKPDFMLRLLSSAAKDAERLFYFDPDIVVTAPWSFFEEWVDCGVGLCEDVNSPLQEFHPRRVYWRKYFGTAGINLQFKNATYVNGGFVGLKKQEFAFLHIWKSVQEAMAPQIGGLSRSSLAGAPLPGEAQGPYAPFGKTDQDALNAAVEAWNGNISFLGKEGMGFVPGAPVLLHALGQPKPWKKNFIVSAFQGKAPSSVERAFWHTIKSPISSYHPGHIRIKQTSVLVAGFIGRFYQRR